MSDQFTLKLHHPFTEEEWDAITDVDFDHTEEIFFHTKHGKEVTFVKQKKGRWVRGAEIPNKRKRIFEEDIIYCSNCRNEAYWDTDYGQQLFDYCPYCGARMREDASSRTIQRGR